jgi:hypothetical protein
MPKTANNSKPCTCCGKLIPMKTGKAQTCSPACFRLRGRVVKEARRERYQRERLARRRR